MAAGPLPSPQPPPRKKSRTTQGSCINESRQSADSTKKAPVQGHPPQTSSQRDKTRKYLTVYFANVTYWNVAAMDYLREGVMAEADVMMVAEHHRSGGGLNQQLKALRKMGWAVTAEAAASTGTAQVREGRGGPFDPV